MASPYLEQDEIIRKMVLSLRDLSDRDLDDGYKRAKQYIAANINSEAIVAHDDAALARETIRRENVVRRERLGSAAALVLLFAGFYAVWCATPAWAASATIAEDTDWSSSFLDAFAGLSGLLLIAYLVGPYIARVIYPNPHRRDAENA